MPKGVRGSGTARKKVLSPEEAQQERERLQAQLQELEAYDARRYAVVGRVVMKLAESDEAFATQLRGILDRGITDRHERQALGLEETVRRGRRRQRSAADEAPADVTASMTGIQP